MRLYDKDVDLNGYKRGAHEQGEEICKQYVFTVPGYDGTVWGWNDVRGFNCKACGRPATEHIVLKAPKIDEPKPKKQQQMPQPTAATLGPLESETRRARMAEEAAKYEPGDMLDEMNDPLAVNARPKPKPLPPPPPEPQAPPAPAPVPTPAQNIVHTSDEALNQQLLRDAEYNEAFKREVERMVKAQTAVVAPVNTSNTVITVPKDKFADAKDLLTSVTKQIAATRASICYRLILCHNIHASLQVNLPQYIAQFEQEAMDPATLIEVLNQQGKPALDEVLRHTR